MSFLDRIRECNTHDLGNFRPFRIRDAEAGDVQAGWVRHAFADRLSRHPDVFEVSGDGVRLAPGLDDFASRSAAVETVLRQFAAEGFLPGWREEKYPVTAFPGSPPLLQMERAAIPFFGVQAYGVHLNGYVRRPDGLHMWIARRATAKQTYPGMLDNMVAGGQPIGLGLRENLIKECAEEADIPPDLAARAISVGAISYRQEAPEGLKPDVQFVFDLELPAGFVPHNTDGEIEAFMLLPIDEVAAIVRDTRRFKFNCDLVVIDFLVRHGLIGPEHPDYLAIVRGLHT